MGACVLLTACVSNDLGDLEAYSQEILARKGGTIEPLPEVKPYERYLYKSAEAGARDPFEPFYQERLTVETTGEVKKDNPWQDECQVRNPEELERYELDSLRMVGTMESLINEQLWGIVREQSGTVHRVQIGNYMGRNCGKIMQIAEDKIVLREIVKNPNDEWEERPAELALAEE
jgi:type IV pilus assembly protein PilP